MVQDLYQDTYRNLSDKQQNDKAMRGNAAKPPLPNRQRSKEELLEAAKARAKINAAVLPTYLHATCRRKPLEVVIICGVCLWCNPRCQARVTQYFLCQCRSACCKLRRRSGCGRMLLK